MINLKITMDDGGEFNISNPVINNVKEWIRAALMPGGVQLLWFEVIPNTWIQVLHILKIRELTDEEIDKLNNPEVEEEPEPEEPEIVEPKENDDN